ncbi:MAG: hypothetical protein AVDCRST_MAG26-3612 [uncultured Chloroflexia bacterium]|uniref:Uncharacterized protein n=1 Tax=uncultured Chloroflexia bacterium TaxID=1672391 RepID=A0A6J4JPZ4_9CHLR|nr:MAG: hypothetical protein AVDCRST_MAG26-3612 [uncultured Chloroflexia bacterium]
MSTYYVITVRGHLAEHWSAWFEGLTITNAATGEALIAGPVVDQAGLHGLLIRIRDLGLPLLAVRPDRPPGDDQPGTTTRWTKRPISMSVAWAYTNRAAGFDLTPAVHCTGKLPAATLIFWSCPSTARCGPWSQVL